MVNVAKMSQAGRRNRRRGEASQIKGLALAGGPASGDVMRAGRLSGLNETRYLGVWGPLGGSPGCKVWDEAEGTAKTVCVLFLYSCMPEMTAISVCCPL